MTAPPHRDLAAVAAQQDRGERKDLHFLPWRDERPGRVLDRWQRARFDADGYLLPFTAYPPAEAIAVRAGFDRLLGLFQAAGKDSYAINGFHTRCRTIYDIVMNPRILDVIEDLIGPDLIAWGTHFFCKMPGDPKQVSWHQDGPYWHLTPARTVTVWLAIDDADVGNAAMSYLAGSHLYGALPRRSSTAEERNVLWETTASIDAFDRPERRAVVALQAGQFALHSDLLVHGSPANTGPRRRCGLTIRYCPPSVRSDQGWNRNAILCRGRDASGHWQFPAAPMGDSPFGEHQVIGAN